MWVLTGAIKEMSSFSVLPQQLYIHSPFILMVTRWLYPKACHLYSTQQEGSWVEGQAFTLGGPSALFPRLSPTSNWLELVTCPPRLQQRQGVHVFLLPASTAEKAKGGEGWKGYGVYWSTILPQQTFSYLSYGIPYPMECHNYGLGVVNIFFKNLGDKLQMTLDFGFKTVQYCRIQDQDFDVLE